MLPLDPIRESPVGPWPDRLLATATLLCALGFVWFLSGLTPDPRGHGTHEQLGMERCGWVIHYGKPCPTCGVTTAATHLVQLHPWQALKTQPFGATLAGFGLWLGGVAAWTLIRRRAFMDLVLRLPFVSLLTWGLLLLLGSWAYTYYTFAG
ncbi:MAG: DUF2752 domain-containing protein [Planctomycetes bacterium]|nr:DUF2752 domain-containing protein [Planctomycetota bacterium]MCB9872061.1 DUF2752 domain-containing protein [Planctomycetota bacterium]MCB9889785.1 DUF2752 domain-containing protein [Planctomycetota bacterium]